MDNGLKSGLSFRHSVASHHVTLYHSLKSCASVSPWVPGKCLCLASHTDMFVRLRQDKVGGSIFQIINIYAIRSKNTMRRVKSGTDKSLWHDPVSSLVCFVLFSWFSAVQPEVLYVHLMVFLVRFLLYKVLYAPSTRNSGWLLGLFF